MSTVNLSVFPFQTCPTGKDVKPSEVGFPLSGGAFRAHMYRSAPFRSERVLQRLVKLELLLFYTFFTAAGTPGSKLTARLQNNTSSYLFSSSFRDYPFRQSSSTYYHPPTSTLHSHSERQRVCRQANSKSPYMGSSPSHTYKIGRWDAPHHTVPRPLPRGNFRQKHPLSNKRMQYQPDLRCEF